MGDRVDFGELLDNYIEKSISLREELSQTMLKIKAIRILLGETVVSQTSKIVDEIMKAMSVSGVPMTPREVCAAIERDGFRHTGQMLLSQRVINEMGQLVADRKLNRVCRGVYVLPPQTEPAPLGPKSK